MFFYEYLINQCYRKQCGLKSAAELTKPRGFIYSVHSKPIVILKPVQKDLLCCLQRFLHFASHCIHTSISLNWCLCHSKETLLDHMVIVTRPFTILYEIVHYFKAGKSGVAGISYKTELQRGTVRKNSFYSQLNTVLHDIFVSMAHLTLSLLCSNICTL